ncbi:MAG: hypothetical protein ACJAUV_000182 [Flavobacteriales bacterium]|jgi:hypothetical protein
MKKYCLIIFLCAYNLTSFAQGYCATDRLFNTLNIDQTHYDNYQRNLSEKTENYTLSERDQVYIIPVVFHIIHQGGIENIPDDQVFDQMRIINEDFRKKNAKIDEVIPEFQSIAGDSHIEFRLAKFDPQGNCTSGIIRHYDEKCYARTLKNADSLKYGRQWPRDQYLNIYVLGSIETSGGGTTLGFAYYPITVDNEKQVLDGIMQVYTSVGSFGTSSERYSGVLTHEIGHYFHLHHTWGQGTAGASQSCLEDDDVLDTPNTKGNPSVCNLDQQSCNSLDNVQNFMDYSFCYAMLTQGQGERMAAVLNDTIADRNNLWQASNLILTGADDAVLGDLCFTDFEVLDKHKCIGDTFSFIDKSYHYVDTWDWDFEGNPTFEVNNTENARVMYNVPGVYSVGLKVKNNSDSLSSLQDGLLFVHDPQGITTFPYLEDFSTITALKEIIWDGYRENTLGFKQISIGQNDNSSIMVDNFNSPKNSTHILETTTFDLTNRTSVQMVFNAAYAAKKNPIMDKIDVYVSIDCGDTWNWIKKINYNLFRSGANNNTEPFVPNTNQWRTLTADIPSAYYAQNTRFRLEYYTLYGNNFYLDNFQLIENPLATINNAHLEVSTWILTNEAWVNNAKQEIVSYQLYDVYGRKLKQGTSSQIIHNYDLPAGIYVIHWNTNTTFHRQKVIKP